MITKEQVKLAEDLWEAARQSSANAYEAYRLLSQSQQTFLDSYRAAGLPPSAVDAFQKLIDGNAAAYKAAFDHMENMGRSYQDLLEQFKKSQT